MLVFLEELATEIRRRAGLGADDNELATTIAVRLLGEDGVVVVNDLQGGAYLRRRADGGYQIALRPDVPDIRFAIAHELAHFALREIARCRLDSVAEERAANYVGAAILAPAPALRRAHAHFGSELRQLRPLAKTFGLSQTSTQLRLAEVLGDKRAVVTAEHKNVISRGSGWIRIPVLEIAEGTARRANVVRATLRGGIDEGRVALLAK